MALKYVKIDSLVLDSTQVANDVINDIQPRFSFITPEDFANIANFDPTKHLYLNSINSSIAIFTGDIEFDNLDSIHEVAYHYESAIKCKSYHCYISKAKRTSIRVNRKHALESPIQKVFIGDRPARIEGIDQQYFTIDSKSCEIRFKNNPPKTEYEFSIRLGRTDQHEPDLYQYSVNVSPNIIPENSIILKWVDRVPKIIVPAI